MAKTAQSQENSDTGKGTKGWADLPIAKLVSAPWNYKKEDEIKQRKLVNNLKRNGQVENIIVREMDTGFFEVVNGNHRLAAFTEIGMTDVHVYNCGTISDAQARRIAIETNETRFETDHVKLAEIVQEIAEAYTLEDISATLPYSSEEIKNMQDLLQFDWNNQPGGSSDGDGSGDADDVKKKITVVVTVDQYDEAKSAILEAVQHLGASVS